MCDLLEMVCVGGECDGCWFSVGRKDKEIMIPERNSIFCGVPVSGRPTKYYKYIVRTIRKDGLTLQFLAPDGYSDGQVLGLLVWGYNPDRLDDGIWV